MGNINKDLFDVVTDYTYALDTLDSYDYQRLTVSAATDRLFLFVYSSALRAGTLADPVPRSAGRITVDLPTEWLGQPLHLYAFLQGYRLRTSDTIYRMLQ